MRFFPRHRCAFALITVGFLAATPVLVPAFAQQPQQPKSWSEVKCDNYKSAWAFTMARRSRKGLGAAFLESHEAFLASGCTTQGSVCPRSPEELDLANLMVILAMNAGAASTFPPFGCKK